jgi:hypothetical protein
MSQIETAQLATSYFKNAATLPETGRVAAFLK